MRVPVECLRASAPAPADPVVPAWEVRAGAGRRYPAGPSRSPSRTSRSRPTCSGGSAMRYADLVVEHRRIIRGAFGAANGIEIDQTGRRVLLRLSARPRGGRSSRRRPAGAQTDFLARRRCRQGPHRTAHRRAGGGRGGLSRDRRRQGGANLQRRARRPDSPLRDDTCAGAIGAGRRCVRRAGRRSGT